MLQNYVSLRHEDHKYFSTDEVEYTSVSKVLNSLSEQTDWNAIAGKVAGRGKFTGMSKKDVLWLWEMNKNKSLEHGTRTHLALENYSKSFRVAEEDTELKDMIVGIHEMYTDFYRAYDEVCLYSAKYGIAGTADKLLVVKKNSGMISIADYKTSLSKGKLDYYHKDGKYLLGPVSHLQDCSYNRYCLQLSLYGVLYEELTGGTIRDMFIIFIPADNPKEYQRIALPYLRSDAINVLEWYSAKKNTLSITASSEVLKEQLFDEPNF